MPRPLASALLAFLACAGCDPEHLDAAKNTLSAVPEHLTSARHFVGQTWTESVAVLNGGEVALPVTWTVDPPVRSAGLPAILEPGQTKVALTLMALKAGPFAASAVVDTPGLSASISIDGVIQDIPACDAGPCQVAAFDLDAGACAVAAAADGTSCADPCLDQPACLGGNCVGTAHSCDDGNACTTDACDPVQGCVHVPISCPTSRDPCLTGACNPVDGCQWVPVADGTSCGPSDAYEASVCINGTCEQKPAPGVFVPSIDAPFCGADAGDFCTDPKDAGETTVCRPPPEPQPPPVRWGDPPACTHTQFLADGGIAAEAWVYDAEGRVSSTWGSGGQVDNQYDACGHLVRQTVIHPDQNVSLLNQWNYDGNGLLSLEVGPSTCVAYAYALDPFGRVLGREESTRCGTTDVFVYAGARVARVEQVLATGAIAGEHDYTYYPDGTLAKILRLDPLSDWESWSFDDAGYPTGWNQGTDHSESWEWDGAHRLTGDWRQDYDTFTSHSFTYDGGLLVESDSHWCTSGYSVNGSTVYSYPSPNTQLAATLGVDGGIFELSRTTFDDAGRRLLLEVQSADGGWTTMDTWTYDCNPPPPR